LKNSQAIPSGTPITLSGTLNTDASTIAGGGFFTAHGPITFNGGTLTTSQGANASSFQSYALNGTITVTGSSASSITSTLTSSQGNGIHLAHNIANVSRTINVADVTGDANADLTISARLLDSSNNAGATGITKTGSGTLSLTGENSYTGDTLVSDGTLIVNGNISTSLVTVASGATLSGTGTVGSTTVNGTLAPGNSIGTLNVSGTLSLANIATFEIDPTNGIGFDRSADLVSASGAVSYDGTLNVLYGGLASDFTNGMIFNLFRGSSFSGSFDTVNLPLLTGGLTWQDNLLSNGTLTVIPEPSAALLGGIGVLALLRRRR
jgi:autotransporter-associated beta strand protein